MAIGAAGCGAPEERETVAARRVELDRVAEGALAERRLPGLAIAILEEDRLVYSAALGLARIEPPLAVARDSRFDLASISKTFTAAAAMKLVDRGALGLDDPVDPRLPELAPGPPLRTRHLLTQTAGLPEIFGLPGYRAIVEHPAGDSSLAAVVAEVGRAPRRFAPGETWSYSNSNFAALALLVERVAGMPYERFLAEEILVPAGLVTIRPCAEVAASQPGPVSLYAAGRDGGFTPVVLDGERHAFVGFGELCGTAEEVARFFRALATGRIVSRESFLRMTAPTSVAVGGTAAYGFGLSLLPLLGREAYWHTGSAGTVAAYFPGEATTFVVLSNRDGSFAEEVLKEVVRALWKLPEPPPLDSSPPRTEEIERFAGVYEDGLFRFTIASREGALWLDNPPFGAPRRLARQRGGRWVSVEEPEGIAVEIPDPAVNPGVDLLFEWAGWRSFARRFPVEPAGREGTPQATESASFDRGSRPGAQGTASVHRPVSPLSNPSRNRSGEVQAPAEKISLVAQGVGIGSR